MASTRQNATEIDALSQRALYVLLKILYEMCFVGFSNEKSKQKKFFKEIFSFHSDSFSFHFN